MTIFHEPPSLWVKRFAPLIRPGGKVLDLACGSGRNARWLAGRGRQVLAVDRDAEALAALASHENTVTHQIDLEHSPWPFARGEFDAIVVCRYLHRPLLSSFVESLADDGLLIYETFMTGQETIGRPRNPEFLLRRDELLRVFADHLQVIAFEQGLLGGFHPAFLQRICARRSALQLTY